MMFSVKTIPVSILKACINTYRYLFSPYVGCRCRFMPTCSQYALEALEKHGFLSGVVLIVWRLCRCHPFGGWGIDNVPEHPSLIGYKKTFPYQTDYKLKK